MEFKELINKYWEANRAVGHLEYELDQIPRGDNKLKEMRAEINKANAHRDSCWKDYVTAVELDLAKLEAGCALIYHFHEAPECLRLMSHHGGDEDYVVVVAPETRVPSPIENDWRNSDVYELPNGITVIIMAHA